MATLLTLTYFASCFPREAPRVHLHEFNYYEEPLLGIFLAPCRNKTVPEGINNGVLNLLRVDRVDRFHDTKGYDTGMSRRREMLLKNPFIIFAVYLEDGIVL